MEVTTLDDLLIEYVAAFKYAPTHTQMMEWIKKYPKYKQELADFTIAWVNMECSSLGDQPIDHARLVEQGMKVVERILAEKKAKKDA
jgi:hypothetical protein